MNAHGIFFCQDRSASAWHLLWDADAQQGIQWHSHKARGNIGDSLRVLIIFRVLVLQPFFRQEKMVCIRWMLTSEVLYLKV